MEQSTVTRIRPLSEETVSQIAAGEVVERPASVLKELLENSLDAGAAHIQISIEEAGKKRIRVSDDGCGMPPEECRLALQRHATSKIRSLGDLEQLQTFGFRGEALPAIASISHFTLTSCVAQAPTGWQITRKGPKILFEREAPPKKGTAVEVQGLFFNTPARAKFLKSEATEKSHLLRIAEETALAHPWLRLDFDGDQRSILRLAPQGKKGDPFSMDPFRKRAEALLGTRALEPLIPFLSQSHPLRFFGLLAPIHSGQARRGHLFWFVNRRPIFSRLLQHALLEAYRRLHRQDLRPQGALFLEIDPLQLDVNVHPAKREVRFREERAVHDYVLRAVLATLEKERKTAPLIPTRWDPVPSAAPSLRACVQEGPLLPLGPATETSPDWYRPPFRFLGPIEKTYLVWESQGGLCLMDQHAAAERVLFERYLAQARRGQIPVQKLLVPVLWETSASQAQKLQDHLEWATRMGFELRPRGPRAWSAEGVPAVFFSKDMELEKFLEAICESLGSLPALAEERGEYLAGLACRAAVKAHDPLAEKEALQLLEDLARCQNSLSCPHGRPSLLTLSRSELARRFGRPGPPPLRG
ncbi:MAG: DNA mismatch repair endonuclease MutL [Elusimicrobia bacterium]|nr:DNA mismatch repair endonuclease MutL [Elusimicrobiota bacterium]